MLQNKTCYETLIVESTFTFTVTLIYSLMVLIIEENQFTNYIK